MKWFIALVLIAAVVVWVWFSSTGNEQKINTVETTPTGQINEIEVTKTDVTENGVSNLPVGFPRDIPVEANNVTESFRTAFQSRGIVQYSVSYTSLKSRDALWDAYSAYLNDAGYTLDKLGTSRSLGQISGEKDGKSLSVVISSHNGLSLAQINYIER